MAYENIVEKGENMSSAKFNAFSLNLTQNDKYLDWSKLKAFADDKINVTQN